MYGRSLVALPYTHLIANESQGLVFVCKRVLLDCVGRPQHVGNINRSLHKLLFYYNERKRARAALKT